MDGPILNRSGHNQSIQPEYPDSLSKNPAPNSPIHSSRRIGDDVAIDYTNVFTSGQMVVHSILLTRGDSVVDIAETAGYDAAFAPSEVLGKLVYFASEYLPNRKVLLVFDGREVGEFDTVFNQYCCWDGPPIQVYSNGDIVDFFAQRDGGWYHIQAGNLASLAPSPPTMSFDGQVIRGENFEHEIGQDLVFRLQYALVDGEGWTIRVGDRSQPGYDFGAYATPPFRGANSRFIEGWHFRNDDNSGRVPLTIYDFHKRRDASGLC